MTRDYAVSVRPLWTRRVAEELKKEGADCEAALAESGLDWRSLNKADGWIPFERHAELLEIAAREFKNDFLRNDPGPKGRCARWRHLGLSGHCFRDS